MWVDTSNLPWTVKGLNLPKVLVYLKLQTFKFTTLSLLEYVCSGIKKTITALKNKLSNIINEF